MHPIVKKLACHLPDDQLVLFDDDSVNRTVQKESLTKLMPIFNTNWHDEKDWQILYEYFPQFYTWKSKNKFWHTWKIAKRDVKTGSIGWTSTISLSAHHSEIFHLWMLLYNVTDTASFHDLKCVDINVRPTFIEAFLPDHRPNESVIIKRNVKQQAGRDVATVRIRSEKNGEHVEWNV